MALRIRSIYPSQWKDDAFMDLSFPARLLALALRNMADDHGVFAWKIKTIKAECFPGDDGIDVVNLLDEISRADLIKKVLFDGLSFGLIRNFCLFNYSRHPSYEYPLPEIHNDYVGLGTERERLRREKGQQIPDRATKIPAVSPKSAGRRVEKGRVEKGNKNLPLTREAEVADQGLNSANPYLIAVAAYNAVAERVGIPTCQRLTDRRKAALASRLKEGGPNCWPTALAKLEASSFLTGNNPKGFKADFDFVLQATSFHRLLEGRYDNRQPRNAAGDPRRGPQGPDMESLARWATKGDGDS